MLTSIFVVTWLCAAIQLANQMHNGFHNASWRNWEWVNPLASITGVWASSLAFLYFALTAYAP